MNLSDLLQSIVHALHPAPTPTLVAAPDGLQRVALVPEGYTLERLAGPKGSRPSHIFHDVRDLCSYLKIRADPTTTDVLLRDGQIMADLDASTPHAGRVSCQLLSHPLWLLWARMLGQPLATEDLLEGLRAVRETLPPPKDGQPAQADVLISSLGSFSVISVGEYKTETDRLGNVSFRGATEKTSVTDTVPASVTVHAPLIAGIQRLEDGRLVEAVYKIPVLLKLRIGKDKAPSWTLSAPTLPLIKAEALADAVAYVRHLLGDGWLVGMGEAKRDEVSLPCPSAADELPPVV